MALEVQGSKSYQYPVATQKLDKGRPVFGFKSYETVHLVSNIAMNIR